MRAHAMQSLANWRYSSALDMLPSSSHTGGSATGLSVTNAQRSPVGDAQVCASLTTIANFNCHSRATPSRFKSERWRTLRNRCAVPWTVTGVLDQRESLRITSHAKDGSPSLSGLTAFFDLAWMMVRFARGT